MEREELEYERHSRLIDQTRKELSGESVFLLSTSPRARATLNNFLLLKARQEAILSQAKSVLKKHGVVFYAFMEDVEIEKTSGKSTMYATITLTKGAATLIDQERAVAYKGKQIGIIDHANTADCNTIPLCGVIDHVSYPATGGRTNKYFIRKFHCKFIGCVTI